MKFTNDYKLKTNLLNMGFWGFGVWMIEKMIWNILDK